MFLSDEVLALLLALLYLLVCSVLIVMSLRVLFMLVYVLLLLYGGCGDCVCVCVWWMGGRGSYTTNTITDDTRINNTSSYVNVNHAVTSHTHKQRRCHQHTQRRQQ